MRVASKFEEEYKGERCPKCSEVFSNFIIIDDSLLACYKCGTVFVRKFIRDREYIRVKTQLAIQAKEKEKTVKDEDIVHKRPTIEGTDTWLCKVCGKLCKSKLGLASHMRTHKNG